ncbi:MAG: hypothetical protein PHX65_02360 [Sulfurimonas sp.]|nr:hypothetical protein [Sulfurimonas sp.]
MKQPFNWDNYSDQPYPLKDKNYKKQMRKNQVGSLLKTFFISLVMLPFAIIMTPFVKRKKIDSNDFFCMGVDYQRQSEMTLELIEELGVSRVLVRFKLCKMQTFNELESFILKLKEKKITLKIIQDREHIEDLKLLEND